MAQRPTALQQQHDPSDDFPPEDGGAQGPAAIRAAQVERLQMLGATLAKQRDEWISARRASGWDRRVQEDLDQYHARDRASMTASMMDSVEQGSPVVARQQAQTRSTIFIGLTRQKSNAAEARLADILLPTDEKNWGLMLPPDPDIDDLTHDHTPAVHPQTGAPLSLNAMNPQSGNMEPTPVKKSDVAMAAMEARRVKLAAMEKKIEDELIECDYNAESRRVMHMAAVTGTGVLCGPEIVNKTRKSWQQLQGSTYQLSMVAQKNPASRSVDPRLVWEDPDCGTDIQNGKGIYELSQKTGKLVRALADQPGYIREQIARVLQEGPKRSGALVELASETNRSLYAKHTFDVWSYTGEVDIEDLRAAGLMPDGQQDDPELQLRSMSACVVMVNDQVVKVFPNPCEGGDLPYDFYAWEMVSDSPRGYGIPYLMRAPQRVINAAWRMTMDNAAICAGPQIIVRKGKIEPQDRSWALYARKVWNFTGSESESPKDAFTPVEFEMHQAELANIIKMGMDLADAETSTPLIAQGEQGSAPETVGGMQMLMNSANVVLRRLVKQYDDQITKRHIRRYYDYNMAYTDDQSIKGDFNIDARGSSALLVRDIQNQAFMNLLTAGASPIYGKFIDQQQLFKKALQAQHIQPQDIMKSDAEMQADAAQAAAHPPPPDPRVQAAQVAAQGRVEEAKARAASDLSQVQLREKIAEQDQAGLNANIELQRELAMLKYATQEKITIQQAKAQLAMAAMNNRQKADALQTEAELRIKTGSGVTPG